MFLIIVNGKAGSGGGLQLLQKLKRDPLYKKYGCRSFLTEYPGHAEKIATQAANGQNKLIQAVIVVGGDGTLHEVINGLKAYPDIPLGFLPAGTGNDFARGIKLTGKNERIFQAVLSGVRPLYYWTGQYLTGECDNERDFVNSIGFGFDAEIVNQSQTGKVKNRLVKYRVGFLIYVVALFKTVKSFHPFSIELKLDGTTIAIKKVWMVVISNHPYFGGGMKINPSADKDSASLAVLVLQDVPKWKMLLLFSLVFIGKHTWLKEVSTYQAKDIEFYARVPVPFQADGQTGVSSACHIRKNSLPRKIFTGTGR